MWSYTGVLMPLSFRTLAVHAFTAAIFSATAIAQQHLPPWQPSPGHQQSAIGPGAAPDPVLYDGPEYSVKVEDDLVAGKPSISDERVSVPTMTVCPPKAQKTGAALVAVPGGRFN